jgi:ABC-type multidrug transport system ATPase subunit
VSGGERKRASIGVELLTNPSLVFLDEPTTGLDSSTALQVINLLKNLAVGGRTIVSTIHQPSSEIYQGFDRLMLLVRGNTIYQGSAKEAVESFAHIGFECPPLSNPSDYFMKLMNEEGLLVEKIQKGEADNLSDEQIEHEFN